MTFVCHDTFDSESEMTNKVITRKCCTDVSVVQGPPLPKGQGMGTKYFQETFVCQNLAPPKTSCVLLFTKKSHLNGNKTH